MKSVKQLLRQYDIRPQKKLGQSFLEDPNVVYRIADLAELADDETVVEIGAGLGFLTEELAKRAARVIALEIDPRLLAVLADRFPAGGKVAIVPGDVLDYDFSSARPQERITVVGNIPYHISTPILFHLLAFRRSIRTMVLMFQKELAERIQAPPGSKDYGIPSVIVARYASVTQALTVSPTCFYPVPDVVSSVLKIVMRDRPETFEGQMLFQRTVRAAFAKRRKTLRNNLRAAGFADDSLARVFAASGIDGDRRAETLSADEFHRLVSELAGCGNAEKVLDKREGIW